MSGEVFVDGRFVPREAAVVNVLDHGLLYGDGIFEGIRAYAGRVFKLEAHIRRLFTSARAICLTIPYDPDTLAGIVVDACRRNGIVDGYVRLVVTRGRGDLGLDPASCTHGASVIAIAVPQLRLVGDCEDVGLTLVTATVRRVAHDALSPSIKSLNYLNNVLAKMEATQRGADEALLLDSQGYVSEATADNLFVVRGGTIWTPYTSTNLDGITRATMIDLARAEGVPVVERPFSVFDVWAADEAFVCGTGMEVQPVGSLDGRTIGDGRPGPITRLLRGRYHAYVRSHGTPIWPDGTTAGEAGAGAARTVAGATTASATIGDAASGDPAIADPAVADPAVATAS